MDEFWWVSVSSPVVHEIASRLPDINEAIRVFLVHLPDRYSRYSWTDRAYRHPPGWPNWDHRHT
ncbi:hypothetical protein [Streptomyces sp. NPDC017673]|uniref:hypothetical protein n=1 Tax=unclassified Streptomyces TaxID=2593676 RepID=UPI0037A4634F